jgi:hypothetical protein
MVDEQIPGQHYLVQLKQEQLQQLAYNTDEPKESLVCYKMAYSSIKHKPRFVTLAT